MKFRFFSLLIFFIFFTHSLFATHIVGGELSYECKGNNNYEITFKFYRDCGPNTALFDTLITITVFDNFGNVLDTIKISQPETSLVPPTVFNICYIPPAGICVSQAIYRTTVNLPQISGGYVLGYQRCCRNGGISNIDDPGGSGSTYTISITDSVMAECNSSPIYKEFPPTFLCAGSPLIFDHSAFDKDGDQLTYELCAPYLGADRNVPSPPIAPPPPYDLVVYANTYSAEYPIAANVPFKIDSITGLLTGTPSSKGQFVVGVCVKEMRGGMVLSENKRDFQFNVVLCEGSLSIGPGNPVICEGTGVELSAFGFPNFVWSPAVGLSSTTGSIVFANPTVTTTYTIIGNNGINCIDTNTVKVEVLPAPSVSVFSVLPKICLGDSSILRLRGAYNFKITPDSSVTRLNDSTFVLHPIVSTNFLVEGITGTCNDFINVPINVNTLPDFKLLKSANTTCLGSSVELFAKGDYTFKWFPIGSLSAPIGSTITANPTITTTYLVTATDIMGCSRSIEFTIVVLPKAKARFLNSVNIGCAPFKPDILNVSIGAGTYEWYLNGRLVSVDTQPTNIVLEFPGRTDTLMLVATNGLTCNLDTAIITLKTFKDVRARTLPSDFRTCEGPSSISFTNTSSGFDSFEWDFGDGTKNIDNLTPTHFFSVSGIYTVTFKVVSKDGCVDKDIHIIRIGTEVIASFEPDIAVGCGETEIKFNNTSTNSVSQTWVFDDGSTSTDYSPTHTFTPRDKPYFIKLTSVNEVGCESSFTYSVPIKIYKIPIVSFSVDDTNKIWPEKTFTFSNTSNFIVKARRWDFGDQTFSTEINPVHEYTFAGTYTVSLTETDTNGCQATVKISITLDDTKGALWVPNAFSPRSSIDKLRTFIPLGYGLKTYKMEIFSREGDLLFSNSELDKFGSPVVAWDATSNGIESNQGVYIWKIEASYFNGTIWKGMPDENKKFKQIGTVTIIR